MSRGTDVKRTCRTCLVDQKTTNTCVPISKVIELENGEKCGVEKMIEKCIGLQLNEVDDSNLPVVICELCTIVITNFYMFRLKCLSNDKEFRQKIATDIKCEVKVEEIDDWFNFETEVPEHYSSSEHDDSSKSDGISVEKKTNSKDQVTKKKTKAKGEICTVHQCDICLESFHARKDLVRHRREYHLNEINEEYYTPVKKGTLTHYICKICNHFCRHKNNLRVHLRSHTGEKPYKCSICSESFAQKCQVRKHMKVHNIEIDENAVRKMPSIYYRCELCNQGFRMESTLSLHYEQKHPDNQTFNYISVVPKGVEQLCDICGKLVKNLTDHISGHLGTKKFTCTVCGKILATASSLYQHRQRHTDEKKFVCDTCGKNFKLRADLTFHRKTHFEERKHACHLCEKKFLHKTGLRLHLKAHAGEKPFQVYNDRKRERKLLQRLEMEKNGVPLPKKRSREKKASKLEDKTFY